MRQLLALTAIGLALLASAAAAAQDGDEEQARVLFKQGVQQFDDNQFEEALAAFQQADRLNPSWKIAYNIGQCQAALKRYGLAIEAFERYLAEGGDEVPPERRTKVIDELSQFRRMVGGVLVSGEDDVVVVIDDIVRGSTPMNQPILVTAGVQHHIEIVKNEEVLRTLTETVRGESTLEIDLADASPESATPVPEGEGEEPAQVQGEDDGGVSPVWFWVGLGATAVFAAGAIGTNFAVSGMKDEDNEVTRDEYDRAKALRATGLACFGLAVAAGITTGVLAIFTDWDGGDEGSPAELQVGAFGGDDGAGLTLQGSF